MFSLLPLPLALMLRGAGDSSAWYRGRSNQLCLLPFASDDVLLPGESLQIHLFDPSQLALLETAIERDSGCLAMLLEGDDESGACAVAPLLELHEQRQCDAGGFQCSFGCVGAVRLRGVELQREPHEFLVSSDAAAVRELRTTVDFDSADEEEAFLTVAVQNEFEEVNALRRRILSLRRRFSGGQSVTEPPPAADEFVRWGHRLEPEVCQ